MSIRGNWFLYHRQQDENVYMHSWTNSRRTSLEGIAFYSYKMKKTFLPSKFASLCIGDGHIYHLNFILKTKNKTVQIYYFVRANLKKGELKKNKYFYSINYLHFSKKKNLTIKLKQHFNHDNHLNWKQYMNKIFHLINWTWVSFLSKSFFGVNSSKYSRPQEVIEIQFKYEYAELLGQLNSPLDIVRVVNKVWSHERIVYISNIQILTNQCPLTLNYFCFQHVKFGSVFVFIFT